MNTNHHLHDPDTSDLVPAADSGIQTEPAAEPTTPAEMYSAKGMAFLNHHFKQQFEEVLTMRDLPQTDDVQALLTERDAWLKSRVAYHLENCPF